MHRRSCFKLAAMATFPDAITEVPGHTWPPEPLLHQRGGPALALVCRLVMATVHCCTAVPLRHHKLKDGLLRRPDIGLAIQEAVLEEQLLLGLNIGSCSFLIENRQESSFEGFPGSPKVLHHLVEHRVILLFYLQSMMLVEASFAALVATTSSGLASTPSGSGRTPTSARSSRGVMALSNTALTPG